MWSVREGKREHARTLEPVCKCGGQVGQKKKKLGGENQGGDKVSSATWGPQMFSWFIDGDTMKKTGAGGDTNFTGRSCESCLMRSEGRRKKWQIGKWEEKRKGGGCGVRKWRPAKRVQSPRSEKGRGE